VLLKSLVPGGVVVGLIVSNVVHRAGFVAKEEGELVKKDQ